MDTYLQTVKDEWVQLINETKPHIHQRSLTRRLMSFLAMRWELTCSPDC